MVSAAISVYTGGMTDIDMSKLTHREIMFVHHYLKLRNGTKAVIAAGYDVNGENSASTLAWGLLRNVKIRPIIHEANQARLRAVRCDAEWVLTQLKAQYEFNVDDFLRVSEQGKPYYDFSEATPEQMHCLESIDITPTEWGHKIKIKTMGKKAILDLIGKHTNIEAFKERIEIGGEVNIHFDDDDREA